MCKKIIIIDGFLIKKGKNKYNVTLIGFFNMNCDLFAFYF